MPGHNSPYDHHAKEADPIQVMVDYGLSLTQISEMLGCSKSLAHHWNKGYSQPSAKYRKAAYTAYLRMESRINFIGSFLLKVVDKNANDIIQLDDGFKMDSIAVTIRRFDPTPAKTPEWLRKPSFNLEIS